MNHTAQLEIVKQMSSQESRSSAGSYQADEQAGRHAAQLAIVKQLIRQESRSSAVPHHVTEHALLTLLIIQLLRD